MEQDGEIGFEGGLRVPIGENRDGEQFLSELCARHGINMIAAYKIVDLLREFCMAGDHSDGKIQQLLKQICHQSPIINAVAAGEIYNDFQEQFHINDEFPDDLMRYLVCLREVLFILLTHRSKAGIYCLILCVIGPLEIGAGTPDEIAEKLNASKIEKLNAWKSRNASPLEEASFAAGKATALRTTNQSRRDESERDWNIKMSQETRMLNSNWEEHARRLMLIMEAWRAGIHASDAAMKLREVRTIWKKMSIWSDEFKRLMADPSDKLSIFHEKIKAAVNHAKNYTGDPEMTCLCLVFVLGFKQLLGVQEASRVAEQLSTPKRVVKRQTVNKCVLSFQNDQPDKPLPSLDGQRNMSARTSMSESRKNQMRPHPTKKPNMP